MEYKELLKEAKKEIEACKDQYTIDESFMMKVLFGGDYELVRQEQNKY